MNADQRVARLERGNGGILVDERFRPPRRWMRIAFMVFIVPGLPRWRVRRSLHHDRRSSVGCSRLAELIHQAVRALARRGSFLSGRG